MHVDFIRKGKKNIKFLAYIGTEHNYFPLSDDNKPNYEIFNWDSVANDWLKWINEVDFKEAARLLINEQLHQS